MADVKEPRHEERDDGACAQWCLTEFDSDNLGLNYERPSDFVTSQWPFRQRMYILYRVLAGVALIGWLSGDVVYETEEFYHGQAWRWFGFASNWSFTLLALAALMQMVTTSIYAIKPYWIVDPIYIRTMPIVLKIQWIIFNMGSNSALIVTTGYWAFIAFVSDAPVLTSDMSRLKHTANSIYVVADVMIGATPIRVYHMFYTVFLGSLYTVFNALYYLNNGSLLIQTHQAGNVTVDGRTYYFMNWAQPVEAICTCVLAVVMSMFSQVVLHFLYQFRLWLHSKWLPGGNGMDAELQQIIGGSNSYNSIDEVYGERVIGH